MNLDRAKVICLRRTASWLLLIGVIALVLYLAVERYRRIPAAVLHNVIRVGELDREYRLVIPDRTRGEKNLPVLFALHGATHTTDELAAESGLDELAAKHGFLLVYLQGRIFNWPPGIPPENPEYITPDLEFFDAMCDAMVAQYAADRSRIYVVGVSQGGGMCNLLVALRSERIAAAVCNCGWIPAPFDTEPLRTPHKTPMLFLVGSLDENVSPSSVKQARDIFTKAGHPVEFKILEGVGHGWNREAGVNDLIWQFLSQKKL